MARLIIQAIEERGTCRILDLGGTEHYWDVVWSCVPRPDCVGIELVNLTPERVTRSQLSAVAGDACNLSAYTDHSVDIVHSNSVIEHLVSWDNMTRFAREARRVGRALFVQVPYFWFPIEPHYRFPFFHWLPEPTRHALVRRFALGRYERMQDIDSAVRLIDQTRLLTKNQMRWLFPDATIVVERIAGIPKSLIAVRDHT